MFSKREHKEQEIGAKIVQDTYSETKILVPIRIHSVDRHTGWVTVKLGKDFHGIHEGDTLTVEIDLDQVNLAL